MVVLFVNENDFYYYRNCLYNHRYKFSSEKEQVNESQYIVSRPDSVRICHSGRIGNGGMTFTAGSARHSSVRTNLLFSQTSTILTLLFHFTKLSPVKDSFASKAIMGFEANIIVEIK